MLPFKSVLFLRVIAVTLGFNAIMTFIGVFRLYGRLLDSPKLAYMLSFAVLYFVIHMFGFLVCLSHIKLSKSVTQGADVFS